MRCLHARYPQTFLDFDSTARKARIKGFKTNRVGGRPSKSGESPGAQLLIELRGIKAKVLVSRSTVQVYWQPSYARIEELEDRLKEVFVPQPGTTLPWKRLEVPTILGASMQPRLRKGQILLLQSVDDPNSEWRST